MIGDWARGWRGVLLAVLALGIASLLSNITTTAQLSGEDQGLFAVRRTVSLVLNSGTGWAGVSVLAGWLVCRPLAAALAGPVAGVGSLLVHYGIGELTGLMPPGSFADNGYWFVAAMVLGAPLGLVGALARSTSGWGLLARFVVPVGAVLEPWVVGWWDPAFPTTTAERASNVAAAVLLTLAGLVGAALVGRARRRGPGRATAHGSEPRPASHRDG